MGKPAFAVAKTLGKILHGDGGLIMILQIDQHILDNAHAAGIRAAGGQAYLADQHAQQCVPQADLGFNA